MESKEPGEVVPMPTFPPANTVNLALTSKSPAGTAVPTPTLPKLSTIKVEPEVEPMAKRFRFPMELTERSAAGVFVPIPVNPLASTIKLGVEVPVSPITNAGVVVPCVSMENVPHGLVVPIPTLPIIVESIVRIGTALVEVAMLHALMALVRIVEVEDEA